MLAVIKRFSKIWNRSRVLVPTAGREVAKRDDSEALEQYLAVEVKLSSGG